MHDQNKERNGIKDKEKQQMHCYFQQSNTSNGDSCVQYEAYRLKLEICVLFQTHLSLMTKKSSFQNCNFNQVILKELSLIIIFFFLLNDWKNKKLINCTKYYKEYLFTFFFYNNPTIK